MSDSLTPTVEEGARLLQAGDTAGALSILSQVVAAEPANGKAYGMLGICFAKLGDMDAAINTLQEAARLLPQDVSVRYNLANAMFQAKNMQGARAVAESVLKLNPGHQNATALLTRIAAAAATGNTPSSTPTVSRPVASPASPASFASPPQNWNPSAPQPLNQPLGGMPPSNWNPGLTPPPQPLGAGPGGGSLGGPSHLGGMALDGTPVPTANWGPPPAPPGYPQPGHMPPPPGMGLPPPGPQGMRYAPPMASKPTELAPGIGLRLVRGILWGAIFGQVWTLWTIFWELVWSAGSFGRMAGAEGLVIVFFVVLAVVFGFTGSVAGFIIGAMDADDDAGAIVGVVAGLLLCGLEWFITRSRLGFVNIFFYYYTGRFIGTCIALRVQKSVIR